jgi:hypothetical protein
MENVTATESNFIVRTVEALRALALALHADVALFVDALAKTSGNDLAPLYAMYYGGTVRDARKLGVATLRDRLAELLLNAYNLGWIGEPRLIETKSDGGDADKRAFNDMLIRCHEVAYAARPSLPAVSEPAPEAPSHNDVDEGQPADISARDEARKAGARDGDVFEGRDPKSACQQGDVIFLDLAFMDEDDVPGYTVAGWYFLRGERFDGPHMERSDALQAGLAYIQSDECHFLDEEHSDSFAKVAEADVIVKVHTPEVARYVAPMVTKRHAPPTAEEREKAEARRRALARKATKKAKQKSRR